MPIALDIVLEVPRALGDKAIALNKKLDEQPNRVPLGYKAAIPHITLAMGVVEDNELEEVKAMMDQEFGDLEKLTCMVGPIFQQNNTLSEWTAGLAVERTDQIMYLHEDAVGIFAEAGFVVPTMGALHEYEKADPLTLDIIRLFRDKSSFEHYHPHITIGYGTLPGNSRFEPVAYEFDHVALYHLGSHATARRKLHEVRLREANEVVRGGF